jgi:hypothetical protein
MKKTVLALILGIVLLAAFGPEAKAQIPKEGTTLQTWYYSGTYKALPMGQERLQVNYDLMGVVIGDTSKNIFHNASFHFLGSWHAVKGEWEGGGFGVAVRPDGDQVFFTYKDMGKVGVGTTKGTWTIVGGTGKLAGIQGNGEFTCTDVRPAAEGTFQGYCPDKVHYKLP